MTTTLPQISVGVDISKDFLDVHLHPINLALRLDNDSKGINKLIKLLINHTVNQIVCESSGGYERLMIKLLQQKGYNVWLIEPKKMRAFIISEGIRAKTDKIDAKMIALFAAQKQPPYQKFQSTEEIQHLQALNLRRKDLIRLIAEEKTKLQHPCQIYCKESIQKLIAFIKLQIEELDSQIKNIIKSDKNLRDRVLIIESMPGVGKVTASMLVAKMPELGSISNKQAASLLGVAPIIKQSGNSKGIASIEGGRFSLRSIVYMAATVAIRYNPILKTFYERLRNEGKKFKVAIVAVMRKIITILNTMLAKETMWQSA